MFPNSFFYPDFQFTKDLFEYSVDSYQRCILFTDTIREQGTNFIVENEKGLPPVLDFDYEIIFNGTDLDRPVNYSLARIMPEEDDQVDEEARPIVIIDPRAGHGPGIGGFRKESEIGIAMKNNHPVYFMIFFQKPYPGQTLADVSNAEIEFIKVIARLHPKAEKPAIIGNCQAGWAAALLSADKPGLTGPLILNGSPLSYWEGKNKGNPMRYKGGLLGGTWSASLCADLGNGEFDGANLVKGFEDLNPGNTFWNKKYKLYSNIDSEKDRFLKFEKWWNGFFFMTTKEIQFITQDLFVGNKLEKGKVMLGSEKAVDLKKLREPIVVFASEGDNITPPEQALNWIYKVWGSVDEIKKQRQVIIYLLHKDIGHLGIFVSSKTLRKEHKEIIEHVDLVNYLTPGLYQMNIETNDNGEFDVSFEAREFEDIDGFNPETKTDDTFYYVDKIAKLNEKTYQMFMGKNISLLSNELTSKVLFSLHPLRFERYMFSDLNPFLLPYKNIAPLIWKNRVSIDENNIYKLCEKEISKSIVSMLDLYRDLRDERERYLFNSVYKNPWLKFIFGKPENPDIKTDIKMSKNKIQYWKSKSKTGGFAEGIIRGILALSNLKDITEKEQLITIKKLVDGSKNLTYLDKEDLKGIMRDQLKVLDADNVNAIDNLGVLIKTPEERLVAIEIFKTIVGKKNKGTIENKLLAKILIILKSRKTLP
ncbi:MAG: DUF3141 domain-containing protein [Deltaproteobacteria bacterium]|nr:DUF3141 domain-containing protein [Deltaproteobacteria bacterium]